MIDSKYLLTDEQMGEFITKGYLVLQNDIHEKLHQSVMNEIYHVMHEEGNPGNNILPRVPKIQQFFDTPVVKGALTSVLGPDYSMHPHRHCHYNQPGNQKPGGGQWHKDGYWSSMRSHRPWWAMIFYYTHDITEDLGPTAIMPGTQYYEKFIGEKGETILPTGKAGTMVLVHFDIWHKATLNVSDLDRYMLKFQFVRLKEPEFPSWNHENPELIVPEGLPAQHLNLWQDVWNWLRGQRVDTPNDLHPDTSRLQQLQKQLQSKNEVTRSKAADEIGAFGEAAEQFVPELGKCLSDSSEITALNASYALARMGSKGINELASQLANGTKRTALRSAYGIQAANLEAIPQLLDILKHEDEYRRGLATFALGMIGSRAEEAVPSLIDCLHDESEWVQRNAAEALGIIRKPGEKIVPALTKALEESLKSESDEAADQDNLYVSGQNYIRNKVGYTAALSLLRAGNEGEDEEVVRSLGQALQSKDRYVRAYAFETLTHLRTDSAIELLIKASRTSRWCSDTHKASTF